MSTGFSDRRSSRSARTGSPARSSFASALRVRSTIAPYVTIVRSFPSATSAALPNGIMYSGPG